MASLTKKQKAILDFVQTFQKEKGYSPTLEEIGKKFSLSSVGTVYQYLDALRKKGYIQRNKGRARSIELYKRGGAGSLTEIPLLGVITAGKPMEPIQDPQPIQVPNDMLTKTGRHYALRIQGNSMIMEGIRDGDVVIVREQPTVARGEVAVAYLPDKNEATLKKIYQEKNRVRLQPANLELEPFYETNVEIQGKVIGVLRKEI
ncbi:MAG: transcriptional repressor LexA [Candidatus Wildermuthbacteria bacterium]|nr:transcriptional repressor LexA [Candidatus Wildermuthbacteria bacterium]